MLIAEKVMGWKVIETDACNGKDNFWLSGDGQNVFKDDCELELELPSYSTDISAAWEVVEKMISDWGYYSTIRPFPIYTSVGFRLEKGTENSDDKWLCNLPSVSAPNCEEMKEDFIEVLADTAPMAICLAALKAKGVDPHPEYLEEGLKLDKIIIDEFKKVIDG